MGDTATMDPPASSTVPEPDFDDGPGPDDDQTQEPVGDAAGSDQGGTPPAPPADLPDDGPDAEQEELPGLELPGHRELGLKVGGRKPDSSVLKLKGGTINLKGQFDRGDRIIAVSVLQVTGDKDQDTIETRSGEVKSTSKTQWSTLCGISHIGDYLREKLAGSGYNEEEIRAVISAVDAEEGSE